MSGTAITLSRQTTLRAGFVGAILGAVATFAIIVALGAFTTQAGGTTDVRAANGPGTVIDVQSALRAHQAREYASADGTSRALDFLAALRAHQAREYGSAGDPSLDLEVSAALRRHHAIEYGGR